MNIHTITSSKYFTRVIVGLGILITAMIIFQAGIYVGYHKATISDRWSDTYRKTFGGPGRMGIGGDMPPFGDATTHGFGIAGKIISISLPNILVSGGDNIEKSITVSTSTVVRELRDTKAISDLHEQDFIVVIGSPKTDGSIDAKLIRIMPEGLSPVR